MKSDFKARFAIEQEMKVSCGTLVGARFELDEILKEKYGQDVKYTLLETPEVKGD